MRRVRRLFLIGLVVALAGCGSSGLEGVLQWDGNPRVGARALSGTIQNTTSHSVDLDAGSMRLLDASGRKIKAHFRLSREQIPRDSEAQLRATWKSGKPVRIDYGSGALALP